MYIGAKQEKLNRTISTTDKSILMVPFKQKSDHQIDNRFENSSETIREVICKQNRQKQLSRNGKEAIESYLVSRSTK